MLLLAVTVYLLRQRFETQGSDDVRCYNVLKSFNVLGADRHAICGGKIQRCVGVKIITRPQDCSTYLALAMHVHKLGKVESWPLHDLDLPDVNIVQGVDALQKTQVIHWVQTIKRSVKKFTTEKLGKN